jgi:imidazolonepropionase-like amidohydrolase
MTNSNGPMNRRRAIALGGSVAAGMMAPLAASAQAKPAASADLTLTGVTIVDTHTGKLSPNMTVSVRDGKISAIVPTSGSVAANAIDAHGQFVVPGYNDYHGHPLGSSDPQGSLTLMLANGITGFREMGAWNTMLEDRRAGTLVPAIPAPELLELAGEILNPGNASTPAIAVATVQKQIARGADFIKIIDYSPDVFFAVAAECKRQNVRFIGHLSPAVNVRDAARAGMRSIEHMGPRDSVLLGCSTDEAALRPVAVSVAPKPAPGGPIPRDVIARSVANPTLSTSPAEIARYQRVIDTFDEAKSHDLAAHFVAAGTWHVPTLIRVRTMAIGDDARYRNDPNLQYVPAQTRQMWQQISQQFSTTFTPESRATLRALFASSAKLVKPFKDGGVNMMAGSDLGGGFVVPGFGLHDEFDLLAEAGLSPLDVLKMTTLNGARFLGRESSMGSVAVGKNANLVLLDADPTLSVANLHRIAGVVRAGTYYSASELAAMKKATADRVAGGVAVVNTGRPACC